MLTAIEMTKLAKSRLREARILYHARCYDGAVYLCGYAIEIGLKCKAEEKISKMKGFPEDESEFSFVSRLKTHKLEELLGLVGLKEKLSNKPRLWAKWQIVCAWNSDYRYHPIGSTTELEARNVLNAGAQLLRHFGVTSKKRRS